MRDQIKLTFSSFISELIFHPGKAATEKEQQQAKILSIALGILTLGILPLVVSIGWAVRWIIIKFSSTDKKVDNVASEVLKKNKSVESTEEKKKRVQTLCDSEIKKYELASQDPSLKMGYDAGTPEKREAIVTILTEIKNMKLAEVLAKINANQPFDESELNIEWTDIAALLEKDKDVGKFDILVPKDQPAARGVYLIIAKDDFTKFQNHAKATVPLL